MLLSVIIGVIILNFTARKFLLISALNPFCWLNFKPVPSCLVHSERKKQLLPVAPLTGLQKENQLSNLSLPSPCPRSLAKWSPGRLHYLLKAKCDPQSFSPVCVLQPRCPRQRSLMKAWPEMSIEITSLPQATHSYLYTRDSTWHRAGVLIHGLLMKLYLAFIVSK